MAAPCTSPKKFGAPGLALKSSMSLLRTTPVPPATTLLPYHVFNVVVTDAALPALSTMEKWVVWVPSRNASAPAPTWPAGVAAILETSRALQAPYSREISISRGTAAKSGSAR